MTETIIQGKTYSLYGKSFSSDEYYSIVSSLTDEVISQNYSEKELLLLLRKVSANKSNLKKIVKNKVDEYFYQILSKLKERLHPYTVKLKTHLEELTLREKFDRTISTSEEQYYLYMLEIELVNRINIKRFKSAGYKIAFLPHCLHDLSRTCMSKKEEIDYVCKGCSKNCYLNELTKILKLNDVNPYIWRTVNLKSLFKKLYKEYKTIGVFGAACIPELVIGIRTCSKYNIPVIGLPLDANRCARWMGDFNPNTINLNCLKSLLNN